MALPVRRTHRSEHPDTAERPDTGGWEPLAELDRLTHQLGAVLDTWRQLPSMVADAFRPLADVEETDDAYLAEIELPGVDRGDIEIDLSGRRLSVRGERKEKERVGIWRRKERTVGRFAYELSLPGDVDDEHVEANLDGGVLTVRLPKPVHDRPRRITIT